MFVTEGTGKITINKKEMAAYFSLSTHQYVVLQPLRKLDITEVRYQGKSGQWQL